MARSWRTHAVPGVAGWPLLRSGDEGRKPGVTGEVLPASVEGARAWLVDQGFCELDRRYDRRAFGNWLLVLANDTCGVRFVRDRSQWFVDVHLAGIDDWYPLEYWCACLEGSQPPSGLAPIEEQVASLRRAFPAILAASTAPDEVERCLRRLREAWAVGWRRLGRNAT